MAIKTYSVNGEKFYEVYVNGFMPRGERFQRRKNGIDTIRKAETLEFEFKRELARLREEKVHERWSEWVKECLGLMKIKYRPSTLYSYEKTVNKWINKIWDKKELREISNRDVHELIFERLPADVTLHTRKYVLKIVKRIFQMAMDHGKIDRNPCHGMTVKVPESDRKVFTSKEVEIFLNEAKATEHRFYSIWVVALFTGMRSGELYALKWTDVDLEGRIISVNKSWSSKNGFTSTKNQKTRVVPVSEQLLGFLKGLRMQRGTEEFVLPHLTEWSRGDAAEVTGKFCKSLGITPIKFHDLRATFITSLLARGESLARVMAIVGHADMETTNVYLRKAGIELKDGTEKLGFKVPAQEAAKVIQLVGR
jgi:integrase